MKSERAGVQSTFSLLSLTRLTSSVFRHSCLFDGFRMYWRSPPLDEQHSISSALKMTICGNLGLFFDLFAPKARLYHKYEVRIHETPLCACVYLCVCSAFIENRRFCCHPQGCLFLCGRHVCSFKKGTSQSFLSQEDIKGNLLCPVVSNSESNWWKWFFKVSFAVPGCGQ